MQYISGWRKLEASGIGAALAITLAGCVGYVEESRGPRRSSPPVVYVEGSIGEREDYVYYPGYEVYYSSYRRQYYYMDGGAWVWRPAPPRVSISVLLGSPSVRMDFHDTPEHHHSQIMRDYPREWRARGEAQGPRIVSPEGRPVEHREVKGEDRKDDKHRGKKKGDKKDDDKDDRDEKHGERKDDRRG